MIHSTACMEPGDSGGGLFDLDGKLVGIRSQIQESLSDNFDVPVNTYRQYWDSLNAGKEFEVDVIPGYPDLGMKIRRSRRGGSRVESVDPDGAAQMVGIEVEDLILQVEGGGRGNIQERIIGRYLRGTATSNSRSNVAKLKSRSNSIWNLPRSNRIRAVSRTIACRQKILLPSRNNLSSRWRPSNSDWMITWLC